MAAVGGSSSSCGRVVVVAGGTGAVGGAVVRRLVATGVRVVVPTRGGAASVPGARVVAGVDWDEPSGLVDVLADPGWRPCAVVAAAGGWWLGPQLTDLDPAAWRDLLESRLTAHMLMARALAPLLIGPDPASVMLGGAAGERPMVGSGPVSVAGAGQRMLLHVLRTEPIGVRVRFHEVCVGAAVEGDIRNIAPVTTIPRERIAAEVERVLVDRTAPAVVRVDGG